MFQEMDASVFLQQNDSIYNLFLGNFENFLVLRKHSYPFQEQL